MAIVARCMKSGMETDTYGVPNITIKSTFASMTMLKFEVVDELNVIIITKPTNALIVCNLFLNHFFKTLSLLLHVSIAYCLSSSGSTYSS